MKSLRMERWRTFSRVFVVVAVFELVVVSFIFGQVSPEEHAKHHPKKANSNNQKNQGSSSKNGNGMMGGGKGMMEGGMGGMMEGGMGSMMEKMGAPLPKELYPSLMHFPNLSEEERIRVRNLAHQRMQEGAQLLAESLDELAEAAPTDDFVSMQKAASNMRQGLAQFESGLAAHRALKEGKSPRNTALNWFKSEMNLSPMAGKRSQGISIFGMSLFHTFIMAGLILFTAAMIVMYYFKMQRATTLLKRLAHSGLDSNSPEPSSEPIVGEINTQSKAISNNQHDSCCLDDSDCSIAGEQAGNDGVLPLVKKKLCRLRVAKIITETSDTKTFRLVGCNGGPLPFSYLPGQFLTFTLPVGKKPIKRSYTISSSPTQGYYCEVTVKREEKGIGSCYLHDQVSVGDTLHVKAPNGKFTFTGKEADDIVLISGGVGITPMMSIARALTDMCWAGDIFFIAACHDTDHFIFKSELEKLQQQNENLHVNVAISKLENERHGYHSGRLNKSRLADWVPGIETKRIHLCGPNAMMDSVKELLMELGVPPSNIHTESFGAGKKSEPIAATEMNASDSEKVQNAARITFAKSEKSTAMLPSETILEASERMGVDIDYSCHVGTCGECMVKLLAGDVTMDIDDGLEPSDRDVGMILACQAKASENISVDA